VKVHWALWSGARFRCSPKKLTDTSVKTVAERLPTRGTEIPPLFWAGILFTKVTVPPASTLAAGGVTFLISTVTARTGAAPALGAIRTERAATPSQPRTAAAMPRCAVRRIRPVAMCCPYLRLDATEE
jgi:hypothetical protein